VKAGYAIGDEIAGYRIEALVGRGGMGVVYRAEQLSLGRTVALKVLGPELAEDEKFRSRFERESRLAALIDHPNIIPVYEAGEADGLLFLAMRWVDGSDLRELLTSEGPLTSERALSIVGQVAGALDAAHARGLVHRDVKPANILVARTGASGEEHVYLSDFGIAKMASSASFTMTGFFVGTPDYAAPEQFTEQEVDGRVDVYALGCLLFQCLTGSPPFVRTQDVAVMYAHLNDPPPRLSEHRPGLPTALDTVIATAMAKQRDDRYSTAGELAAAARAAFAAPTISLPATEPASAATTLPAATLRSATPVEPARPATPAEKPEPARRSRRRIIVLAGALLALAGAAAAGIVLATGSDEPASTVEAGAKTSGATTATAGTASATLTWERLTASALGGQGTQEISRLAGMADGSLLAAGTGGPARAHDAIVWTGAGVDQEATFEKEVLAGSSEEAAYGVADVGDDDAVVVGYGQQSPPRGSVRAAVWRRTGGTWAEVAGVPVSAFYEKMNRVARNATSSELAAVGASGSGYYDDGSPLPTDAAVWTSADGGSTWSRADADGFGGPGYQEIRGISAFGGGFVAVGHDRRDGAVWRSTGSGWSRLAEQPSFVPSEGTAALELRAVTTNGGGLVAVGFLTRSAGDRDAAVWTSPDGETWTLVTDQDLGGSGDQEAFGVAAGSFGIVAVGCTECRNDGSRAAVWTSTDGQDWVETAADDLPSAEGIAQLNDVVLVGDALVAGGWEESGSDRNAILWRADLPG